MGFRYEAGARYDWRTNSFGVAWNTADVERSDQLLAAGFMFFGGFGDDFLRGARIGWAARSSEWVDETLDGVRWSRQSVAKWGVDPAMRAADEAAGVVVNGSYI